MTDPSEQLEEAAPEGSPAQAEAIRAAARRQWSRDPAGSNAVAGEELGSPESFARVERERYRQQSWMHDTFHYERFAGQRVLEIGVGLGTDHLQFARAGAIMTGIDLTPRCIDLTRRRFEQEGLSSELSIMDAERLEFPDDSFDLVYSFGVLHHIPSAERAFAEIRRVLRPEGVFLGALYNRWSLFMAAVTAGWLRSGRRESFRERLSRIEHSEGDESGGAYVRLFGSRELKRSLHDAGFGQVRIVRRHFGFLEAERLPRAVVELGARAAGWYVVYEAS